jgi:serine protease Do
MMRRYALFAAIILLLMSLQPSFAMAVEPTASGAEDSPPTINLRRTVTVQVVQKTKDAVVNIATTKMNPERQFNQVVLVPANSLGSGFIIHKDGYVVTNAHVIDRARQITVELSDGRKLPAELLSTDRDADLALLRIHTDTPLPTMELGESDDLLIGEPVIAVGNPLGFSHSVSSGIVSAVHRDIDPRRPDPPTDRPLHGEQAALRDLIQTDAAINPGNSGGPLLNAYGQVIGINTAIRGDAQNIGFAIPVDRLRDLIPALMNPAQVNKVEISLKLAEKRSMIDPATVLATVVSAGPDPLELQSINGEHTANIIDAYAMLLRLKANQPFSIAWSSGKTEQFVPETSPTSDAILQAKNRFGITIEQGSDGPLVTSVDPAGAGAALGLRSGDIIVVFGHRPVRSLNDFGSLLRILPDKGRIPISIFRGNVVRSGILEF